MPSTNKTVPWGLSQFVSGDSPGMPDWNEDCKRTNDALEEVKNIRAALAPPRGRYDTYELLAAAHPAGEAGQAYLVGVGSQPELYVWDVDQADWIPAGNLQGVPGPNEITTATATPLSGVLVGEAGLVREGVPGEDFSAVDHIHADVNEQLESLDVRITTHETLPASNTQFGHIKTGTFFQLSPGGVPVNNTLNAIDLNLPNSTSPEADLGLVPNPSVYVGFIDDKTGYPARYGGIYGYKNQANSYRYCWQIFTGTSAQVMYRRYATSATEWSAWKAIQEV